MDSELLLEIDPLEFDSDSEPEEVATEVCPFCNKPIPTPSLAQHTPSCRGRRYLGKVGFLLNEANCLPTLSKIAHGCHDPTNPASCNVAEYMTTHDSLDVQYLFDHGTNGIIDEIPVKPVAPDVLTDAIKDAMKTLALDSGCRTERRFDKHFDQEVVLCAQIAQMIRQSHPEIYDRAVSSGDATAEICIIDCGAAAGELLHIFQALFKTAVVLVEFYTPPRMVDALYEGNPNFSRLWKKVEEVTEGDLAPMRRTLNIVVAKHLCGDSTDAAMCCVVDEWRRFFPVTHFVAAPCCQQMSTWDGYSARNYLEERFAFAKENFEVVRAKVGWKSLLHRDSRERHRVLYEVAKVYEYVWHIGRVHYLASHGAQADVFQFVPEDVTIKNVVITAWFKE